MNSVKQKIAEPYLKELQKTEAGKNLLELQLKCYEMGTNLPALWAVLPSVITALIFWLIATTATTADSAAGIGGLTLIFSWPTYCSIIIYWMKNKSEKFRKLKAQFYELLDKNETEKALFQKIHEIYCFSIFGKTPPLETQLR